MKPSWKPSLYQRLRINARIKWLIYWLMLIAFPYRNLSRKKPKKVKKILILGTGFIGDFVLATAAIKSVRNKFPNAKISMINFVQIKSLTEGFPYVDNIIFVESFARKSLFERIQRELENIIMLQKHRYDIVIMLSERFLDHVSIPLIRANLIAYVRFEGKEPFSGASLPTKDVYRVKACKELVKKIGCQKEMQPWDIYRENSLYSQLKEHISILLKKYKIPQEYIVMHPFASWKPRELPEKTVKDIIDNFLSLDYHVLIIGSKNDKQRANLLTKGKTKCHNFTGLTDIAQTASLMAESKLFIGIDSGPAHMAFAVKVPSVVIFTCGNYKTWHNPGQTCIRKNLVCSPCVQRENTFICARGYTTCLAAQMITSKEVIDAGLKLLNKSK